MTAVEATGTADGPPPGAPASGQGLGARRALGALRHDGTALVGLVLVSLLIVAALCAPLLAPRNPNAFDTAHRFASPGSRFALGSDIFGRDTLSRLLYGARVSLAATFEAALVISLIGVTLGLLAGYLGGLIDTAIVALIDILLSLPELLLALVVAGILGRGIRNIIVGLAAVWWVGSARIVRAAVLSEREKLYVEASRAAGASRARIVLRHLLPNIVAPAVVYVSLDIGGLLLAISALSFLGLGVTPPTPEWGSMLSDAKNYIGSQPQLLLYPGAAIFLFVIGCNLLGDGLRDILDPKTRSTES